MPNSTSLIVTSLPHDGAMATTPVDIYVNYPHRLSDLGYTMVASFLSIVWVIGTTFNTLSLVVFASNKKLRSPTNMFIMSLNVCDLGMSLFGTFPAMTSSWSKRWLYGHLGCIIEGFIVYFLGLTSMYLLCAISFDRYIVIAKPLLGVKITHTVALAAISVCWMGGLLWATMPLFGWNEYVLEGAGVSCSVDWESTNPVYSSFVFTIFFTCFVIPLILIGFSYSGVYMTVRSMSRNQSWKKDSRIAKKNMKVEEKMAKTIVIMLTGFLGCWTPYAIVSFVTVFRGAGVVSKQMATYPAVIAKTQGLWDPLLYVANNKQFRQAFYGILPCTELRQALEKREEDKPDLYDEDDDEGKKGDSGKQNNTSIKNNKVAPEVTQMPEMAPANNSHKVEDVEMADSAPGSSN